MARWRPPTRRVVASSPPAQWSLLERLVAQGGSRPLEEVRWAMLSPNMAHCEGGPFAGLRPTVDALERRGMVAVTTWKQFGTGLLGEEIAITDHGRAMLAEHQTRRRNPATWRKRRGAA